MKLRKSDILISIIGLIFLVFSLFLLNKKQTYQAIIENNDPIEYEVVSIIKRNALSSGKSSNVEYVLELIFKDKKYEIDIGRKIFDDLKGGAILSLYYMEADDEIISAFTVKSLSRGFIFVFSCFVLVLIYVIIKLRFFKTNK